MGFPSYNLWLLPPALQTKKLGDFQRWYKAEMHSPFTGRYMLAELEEEEAVDWQTLLRENDDNGTVSDDDSEEEERKDNKESKSDNTNRSKDTEEDLFDSADEEAIKNGFDCLFRIVLNSGIHALQVESLQHELAYPALRDAFLQSNHTIESLEMDNKFTGGIDPAIEKELVLDLCTRVLGGATSRIDELYFRHLHHFSQEQSQQLFQSLDSNASLKALDLRNGRYIHTWNKAWKKSSKMADLVPEGLISLEPLIQVLKCQQHTLSLKKLDLSGLMVSNTSIVALATALPALCLETLLLRDTSLDTAALVGVAKALRHDNTVKELDISHNTIRDSESFMKELCDSLTENSILRTLKMQHCNMKVGLVEILANALPAFKGLECLYLDANDFGLSPRCVVVDENGFYLDILPVGPILLVDALEHNTNLLHLNVDLVAGSRGESWGMSCCSAPPYSPWMAPQHLAKLEAYTRRNKEMKERIRKTKMQEAVVRLAGFMLEKMNVD
jgi:hypothetical protein